MTFDKQSNRSCKNRMSTYIGGVLYGDVSIRHANSASRSRCHATRRCSRHQVFLLS